MKFSPFVMVWAGFCENGKRFITRLNGTVDSLAYQDMLKEALPILYTPRHLLQQEGTPCHRFGSTTDFLRVKQTRMLENWPPQSAALSPIENFWDHFKLKVMQSKPNTVDDLWDSITVNFANP